jgi:uncharacterized protein (TIRG00374 family)
VRLDWRAVLGIALSIALLWFTLRGEDFHEMWMILSQSNIALWILCTATATAIFPLRARRWQALLAPVAGRIPYGPLWRATAIGMMVNNVVPARAGELARAFALSRERPDVRFSSAFASLAVDRLFDGVIILAMMLLATLDPRFPADAQIFGATAWQIAATMGLVLGVVFIGVAMLAYAPAFVYRVADAVSGVFSSKLVPKVRGLLEGFAGGVGVLKNPKLALEVLWWAVLHWICNALAFYLGFLAIGIDAPISAAFFVQGLIGISVALPGAPGFFGQFELAGKVGLGLYAISDASAVSWAIGFHLLSFVPITVMGAWYFSRLNLNLREITSSAAETK